MAQPLPVRSVIIVDDDVALLHALTFAFMVEGFDVRSYASGESLLAEASLPVRGCLVIDYKLPGLDGFQLLERLRARGVGMPAILMTTLTPAMARRAAAAAVRTVDKPLLNGKLFDTVKELLD
ncbi:response regulator transcription factor [Labrys monachus]|uniref:FixJ family two-component response regulator n=1 Tax=Labrys monachus TaxID=217067 RepID=A0ABU0F8Y6_9HYPH|nr:response regulator [Labrys monachus]MDQ0391074.1 FixJ family two-component response regulator [Labrys monachus]